MVRAATMAEAPIPPGTQVAGSIPAPITRQTRLREEPLTMRGEIRKRVSWINLFGAVAFSVAAISDIVSGEAIRWILLACSMAAWMAVSFGIRLAPVSERLRSDVESGVALVCGVALIIGFAPALLDLSGWSLFGNAMMLAMGLAFAAFAVNALTRPRETEPSGERL